ncbi:MAG: hypothetical protein ABIR56_16015 [Polaromonas sp.]
MKTGLLALAQMLPLMLGIRSAFTAEKGFIADRAFGTGTTINFRDKQETTL